MKSSDSLPQPQRGMLATDSYWRKAGTSDDTAVTSPHCLVLHSNIGAAHSHHSTSERVTDCLNGIAFTAGSRSTRCHAQEQKAADFRGFGRATSGLARHMPSP